MSFSINQWRKICLGNRGASGELATARLLTVAENCNLRKLDTLAVSRHCDCPPPPPSTGQISAANITIHLNCYLDGKEDGAQ